MYKESNFNQFELNRFREVQQIANRCAVSVSGQLYDGMTEKQAVALMMEFFHGEGVKQFFHKPYAWFGNRTAFSGFKNELDFLPSKRVLRAGMPVILDVAPYIDGYVADIGYTLSFGANSIVDSMRDDLIPFRQLILDGVLAGKTFKAIYQEVDQHIEDLGYINVHQRYPERVLAHRVSKIRQTPMASLHLARFGAPQLAYLLGGLIKEKRRNSTGNAPVWNDKPVSDHPPLPGLWAVEPHIGLPSKDVGAKWEELLVITEDTAYWLDDDVPHVNAFNSREELGLVTVRGTRAINVAA